MKTQFTYLTSAELTDIGRRRKNNEDAMVSLPGQGVFCVADGMGGAHGGEVASKAVVDALMNAFLESPAAAYAVTANAAATVFELAMNEASQWIKNRADQLGVSGMGSTVVGLVFDRVTPSQGIALHAGDSRAYRMRHHRLEQLTTDHSVAAAAGLPDDSTLPPMFRGVITRAVGLEETVPLDFTHFDVLAGDLFLLCSDGLDKMLSYHRIQKILRKHDSEPLEKIAKFLVDEAVQAGGDDNVTVMVIRVSQDLPLGSAMEIPPETLALEQLEAANPESSGSASRLGAHDETGESASVVGTFTKSNAATFDVEAGGAVSTESRLWFWLLFVLVFSAGVATFLFLKMW